MNPVYTSLTYFVRYQDYPQTIDFLKIVGKAYEMRTYPIDKFAIPKNSGVMSELEFQEMGVLIVFRPRPKKVDIPSPNGITMFFDYADYQNSSDFGKMVITMLQNSPAFLIYFPKSRYEYLDFSYHFTPTQLEVKICEKLPF